MIFYENICVMVDSPGMLRVSYKVVGVGGSTMLDMIYSNRD